MKRMMFMLLVVLGWFESEAQPVQVGLYHDHLVNSLVVYCSSGSYELLADGFELAILQEGDILYLTLEEGRVKVLNSIGDFGHFQSIEMRSEIPESAFRIRVIQPELESRVYDDDLLVTAGDRFLTTVNRVDLDKYLAGVVATEAGSNASKEFYKAQSILCRTYALKHLERHQSEGFTLCDGTHCQAYRGKSLFDPEILEAVLETSGMVVADYNFRLITAAYHSNSGGQTERASNVWLTDVDYLQSVMDPHSLHQSSAKWRDTISFNEWKSYLLKNGMGSVNRIPEEIIYVEQMRRKKYFILDKDSIRMTKIREDWGFRSSFFDMFPDGDSILVWGKGYGHGIGMSQEGAIKMAGEGFSYR
ncbi:MAG: SpoIID/LytB domain-containing protein, partial [Bacteroidales bacterium]|nr:SpoIID/LytB domain-containing protein [Bacteroidales bacterium]